MLVHLIPLDPLGDLMKAWAMASPRTLRRGALFCVVLGSSRQNGPLGKVPALLYLWGRQACAGKRRFFQAAGQACVGQEPAGRGGLRRTETWRARLRVRASWGAGKKRWGRRKARGAKASQGHRSEPATGIRAQSAEETHKAKGQGGVCPEHGPLGAQAGR